MGRTSSNRGLLRFAAQDTVFAPDRFYRLRTEAFGGPKGRLIPLPGGQEEVGPLGGGRDSGGGWDGGSLSFWVEFERSENEEARSSFDDRAS